MDACRAGVTLVAGPERLPVARALSWAAEPGRPTMLLSARLHPLQDLERLDLRSGDRGRLQRWIDEQSGAALVVVDGVDAIGGLLPGELPEEALLRLLDGLRFGPELRLLLLEPIALDRLVAKQAALERLLARVDDARLWTGAELLDARGALRGGTHPALPKDAFAPERWLYLAVAAVCAVACFVVFRPSLLGSFQGYGLLGDVSEDLPRSLWLNTWVGERLREGGSWNDTTRIFWPLGAEVVGIFGNLGAALLAQPFRALLGDPGYWNLYLASAVVTNGLAMGWLARRAGADRAGAILGALAFALAPPLMQEIARGDPEVLWAAPLPLAVGLGFGALTGGRREAVMTGLALALASLIWWFHGLFAWTLIGLLWLARLRGEPTRRRELVRQLGRIFKVWLPCLLAAIPVLAAANRGHLPDLDELYLPGEAGPSFGASLVFARMTQDVLALDRLLGVPSLTPGWVSSLLVMVLAFGWIWIHGGRRSFWLVVALGFAILGLGPWLSPRWGMSEAWLPLPLRALQVLVPPLVALDRPDRLLIVTALALALTLALLWGPLSLRLPPRARPWALGGIVAAAGLMPVLARVLPLPTFDHAPPAWVEQITGKGALIHVPLGWSESSILWQLNHGLDVTGGPDEVEALRDPTPYRTAFEETPALAFFRELQRGRMEAEDRAWLRERGAAWVLVHKAFMKQLIRSSEGPDIDALEPLMDRIDVSFGPPVYEDEDVRLYEIR